ncbi:HpcH/HpaI aldolase/citrate lyase family protein [Paenibacillus bovis]|uniref:Citrate lyase subunit beta n=1 Tax=Paenibacillus bovis TaxID=1616788 RepID=A0A172ZAU0_9BACL|nr:HpcH/HpaI aldolase/citrate lyase family protein [Paenibacillus bovis]ANF94629.1 citrate lyase subunit beta [Paenibacillus bovis]
MRYFNYLSQAEEEELFYSVPVHYDNASERELLAYAIGPALYCPATRPTIARDILTQRHRGLTSWVFDLEDAIGDQQVEAAEHSLVEQVHYLQEVMDKDSSVRSRIPLLFIRVRSVEQLQRIIRYMGEGMQQITGIMLPKFNAVIGEQYLQVIAEYNHSRHEGAPVLYGLPILETAAVIYRESRLDELLSIKRVLDAYQDYVLNVRIGATDFSSLFGLRRSSDMTIYDITTIRDCISDIINLFGRMESPYVISGPVWEYFSSGERVLKPQIRQSPFEEALGADGRKLRNEYINHHVDGLIREVIMDKENGMIGKTIIHPSHIGLVQSLYTVRQEEYEDAQGIIANNTGELGVFKSGYANKMNEIKPHLNWARRIMARSQIYGVLHEQQHFISLLSEQERHVYV